MTSINLSFKMFLKGKVKNITSCSEDRGDVVTAYVDLINEIGEIILFDEGLRIPLFSIDQVVIITVKMGYFDSENIKVLKKDELNESDNNIFMKCTDNNGSIFRTKLSFIDQDKYGFTLNEGSIIFVKPETIHYLNLNINIGDFLELLNPILMITDAHWPRRISRSENFEKNEK